MTDRNVRATLEVSEWHGKMILDRCGENIACPHDASVDVETDASTLTSFHGDVLDRHLDFVSVADIGVGSDGLRTPVINEFVSRVRTQHLHHEERYTPWTTTTQG